METDINMRTSMQGKRKQEYRREKVNSKARREGQD